MGDARSIALEQLQQMAKDLGDQAAPSERLKVATVAVRLAECDKTTEYLHRHVSCGSESVEE